MKSGDRRINSGDRQLRLKKTLFRSPAFWLLRDIEKRILFEIYYFVQGKFDRDFKIGYDFEFPFSLLSQVSGITKKPLVPAIDALEGHGFVKRIETGPGKPSIFQLSDRWQEMSEEVHQEIANNRAKKKKDFSDLTKIRDRERSLANLGQINKNYRKPR